MLWLIPHIILIIDNIIITGINLFWLILFFMIFLLNIISMIIIISLIVIIIISGINNMLYVIAFLISKFSKAFMDLVIPQKGHGMENIFLKGQVILGVRKIIASINITCPNR